MKTSFHFRSHSGISRLVTSRLVALGVVLGTFATVPAIVTPAHAQGPITIGVVDEDKLADGYDKYKAAVDALDKRAQDLDQKIPAREFLTDDEGKTFDTLILKDKLTDTDKPQFDTLVTAGMDKRAEYMGLIGKVNRTDADNTRMKTLQDTMGKNGGALRDLSEKLLANIRTQQDSTDKEYIDKADTVVAQVANDKKLLLVVRKRAILWSAPSVDITADVLKRLNG